MSTQPKDAWKPTLPPPPPRPALHGDPKKKMPRLEHPTAATSGSNVTHSSLHHRQHAVAASSSSAQGNDRSTTSFDQRITPQLIKYIEDFKFPHMKEINVYEKICKIGQGTFGEVFKVRLVLVITGPAQARDRMTNRVVALKKILMENEKEGVSVRIHTCGHLCLQFPITALREVKILLRIKHENITELIEVCASRAQSGQHRGKSLFYLVFAYCDHDLAGILSDQKIVINISHFIVFRNPLVTDLCDHAKTIMHQIIIGLDKCHKSKVLHRDMKAANILLSNDGIVKLADFGLSRPMHKNIVGQPAIYTNRVVTLWYRPPELLLGERSYGPAIDMWGAGCIMIELWTRSPVMQGDTEQKQITLISTLCGSINETTFEGCSKLPAYSKMELPKDQPPLLRARMQDLMKNSEALNLCEHLLTLDPKKRYSASDALESDFFRNYSKDAGVLNLKTLMSTIKTSHMELHSAKFRQQNRATHQPSAHGQVPAQTATGALNNHMFDRVF